MTNMYMMPWVLVSKSLNLPVCFEKYLQRFNKPTKYDYFGRPVPKFTQTFNEHFDNSPIVSQ